MIKELRYKIILFAVNSIFILSLVLNSMYSNWVYIEEGGFLNFTGGLSEVKSGFSTFEDLTYKGVSGSFCQIKEAIEEAGDTSEIPHKISSAGCSIFVDLYDSKTSYYIMVGIALSLMMIGNILFSTCIRAKNLYTIAPVFTCLELVFMIIALGIYFTKNQVSFFYQCQHFYTSNGRGSMCPGFGLYLNIIVPLMMAAFLFCQIRMLSSSKFAIEELKNLQEVK